VVLRRVLEPEQVVENLPDVHAGVVARLAFADIEDDDARPVTLAGGRLRREREPVAALEMCAADLRFKGS
jgi:hypothetical protein